MVPERRYWWWPVLPVVTLGFLAWVPFAQAGVRFRHRGWLAAAVAYVAAEILALALLQGYSQGVRAPRTSVGGSLLFAVMLVGAGHALVVRGAALRRLALEEAPEMRRAARRVELRKRARELAREDPGQARELGVGRPDLPGSFDGGLVDLNHAPAAAIARLTGIEAGVAARIVAVREEVDGFSSLEDLDLVLDLPPSVLAELRPLVVLLPRD